ncbi:unnamed protein product [Prorocentrum cordatum]|uniref:Uncharacterized protein n=1 Tax=Prorocentrum cordatum TaxID=2364126 RepID=A0ABN9V4L7_9DINO|nr:unnamed protein product [Polarella glacialis]
MPIAVPHTFLSADAKSIRRKSIRDSSLSSWGLLLHPLERGVARKTGQCDDGVMLDETALWPIVCAFRQAAGSSCRLVAVGLLLGGEINAFSLAALRPHLYSLRYWGASDDLDGPAQSSRGPAQGAMGCSVVHAPLREGERLAGRDSEGPCGCLRVRVPGRDPPRGAPGARLPKGGHSQPGARRRAQGAGPSASDGGQAGHRAASSAPLAAAPGLPGAAALSAAATGAPAAEVAAVGSPCSRRLKRRLKEAIRAQRRRGVVLELFAGSGHLAEAIKSGSWLPRLWTSAAARPRTTSTPASGPP